MGTQDSLHNRYRDNPTRLSVTGINVTEVSYQSLSVTVIAVTENALNHLKAFMLGLLSLLARAFHLIYRILQGVLGQLIHHGFVQVNAEHTT